jgi:hypothetical protein
MEEALRRRITVTASLNEIATDQLGNRVVVRRRGALHCSPSPTAVLNTAGQIFKGTVQRDGSGRD